MDILPIFLIAHRISGYQFYMVTTVEISKHYMGEPA